MINQYPNLAARVFNTPLLIHPQKLDAIIAGLGSRLLGTQSPIVIAGDQAAASLPAEMFSTRRGKADAERGYKVVDGVAVVSVSGVLAHRTRFDGASSDYVLGYNSITADLEHAVDNADVHAVLAVFDTPGGEAQGAFEFSDRVHGLRGKKPMIAIADGLMASAGYLGGSAFDEVVVTQTAYVGSIGVVMRHVDFSAALAADGVKVTHIFAGAHKVDGNPYEPLPESVRADYQAEIDGLMSLFIDAVARNTGLDPMAVRKTQAATYRGVSAVAAGLASRIGTTDQLISELAAMRGRSFSSGQTARATANQGDSMSGNTPAGGQPAATTEAAAAVEAARAEGHAAGVSAERARVSSILGHERAAANMAVAVQCVTTGMTAEQAGAVLGAMPVQAAAAPAAAASANPAFAAAMGQVPNPDVSGIDAAGVEAGADEQAAAMVLSAFREAKGLKA